MSLEQIKSPSPDPDVVSECPDLVEKKGSKILESFSESIPDPVSKKEIIIPVEEQAVVMLSRLFLEFPISSCFLTCFKADLPVEAKQSL